MALYDLYLIFIESSLFCFLRKQDDFVYFRKKGQTTETTVEYPVLYYKKAEAEVKTGDSVMPVYVDYDAVIHCYTMTGGLYASLLYCFH